MVRIIMKLSIIIPILNEARGIPKLLEKLTPLVRNDCEIIIVDGGSEDGSADIRVLQVFDQPHTAALVK